MNGVEPKRGRGGKIRMFDLPESGSGALETLYRQVDPDLDCFGSAIIQKMPSVQVAFEEMKIKMQ